MKPRTILAAAFAVAASTAWAEAQLKIYRPQPASGTDTVYSAKQYVIGITSPGASATIAGEAAHVYRTGSFGTEVELKPGLNEIPVSVKAGAESASATVRFMYIDTPRPSVPRAEPVTSPLATPVNVMTKPGAYLQYGNGDDRLGGSKMGFVAEDIPLTAVGETNNLYQVMLGTGRYAYLPKEYAAEGGTGGAVYNTGSATISNTGTTDRVTLSLPGRLPYWTRSEIDPSTILVTVYGATNNSNWITQRNATEMIDFVDFRQDESDALTIVIRLKEEYAWGYTVGYSGNSLTIDVRHRPASLALKDLTIGLDAGHGGQYPGAISPSGLTEKEVNLDIVLKAAEMLRKRGAKVVLTRDGDTGPSMGERKRVWLDGKVDLAVSVHNNASGNPLTTMGTSCYYKHISNRALAASLHRSMLSLGLDNFGLTGNFNFSLNGPTDYPNALVEVLFMSSLPEEELLADPAYRTRLAEKIVKGIEDYLKEVKSSLK